MAKLSIKVNPNSDTLEFAGVITAQDLRDVDPDIAKALSSANELRDTTNVMFVLYKAFMAINHKRRHP